MFYTRRISKINSGAMTSLLCEVILYDHLTKKTQK